MLNEQSARWVDTTLTSKVGRAPAATLTCLTLITTAWRGHAFGPEPPDALLEDDGEGLGLVPVPPRFGG
jgi:hypothetical protein